jgi:hypothetical protein
MDGAVRANQKGCMQASLISSHFWLALQHAIPSHFHNNATNHHCPLLAACRLQPALSGGDCERARYQSVSQSVSQSVNESLEELMCVRKAVISR